MAEVDGGRDQLISCLNYQRDSVLAIVDGLAEEHWHTSVVPSGWTVAGVVEHLGGAERHWFQQVVNGREVELPWDQGLPEYDPKAPQVCDRPSADVRAYYEEQCGRSGEVLAGVSMSDRPNGRHGDPEIEAEITTVRWVVLHMIEETAAHSGHLEIAREFLDGRTGLGLR
jgi:Protein of unknown function (DUF664)